MKGAAITRVTLTRMAPALIPLPPLAEQHRIVTKVDELMALCDRLETAQTERENRRDLLVAASLNRLNNGADPDAFREHARFYCNHLPRFTMRPEHIQQLRQTILSLAVRGRLTPILNWPEKPEPLREFATLQNGYAFKSEWFVRDGIRLLRNANVGHGVIRWDDLVCLPADRCSEFKRFQLDEGDVVLSLDRPFIVTGTKVARVRPEDLPSLLLQRVGRFQPKLEQLCPDYLFLWLHSPHFTSQIDPGRSNGVPHISSKQVESAEIFVPSLTEQHRIVAKIEELMALCDWLETQLTTTHTESRRLLEAVLHEALAPAV
jgi:type I restriction enzyme, S subunit